MVFVPNTEQARIGTIRLDLTDDWSLLEFEEMCASLRGAYDLINRFTLLMNTIVQEDTNEGDVEQPSPTSWKSLYYGAVLRYQDGRPFLAINHSLEDILGAIRPFSTSLAIDKLRLESPGFLQVIGSWNPLKIIADAVKEYRRENTKRMQIKSHATLERDRLRVDLAKHILGPASVDTAGTRAIEIVNAVIEPVAAKLEHVAANPKVVQLALVAGEDNHPPHAA